MQVTLLISSPEPEVMWNALRLANVMVGKGDGVTVSLNGPAVDWQGADSDRFNIREQVRTLAAAGGQVLG